MSNSYVDRLGLGASSEPVYDSEGNKLILSAADDNGAVVLSITENLDVQLGEVDITTTTDTGYSLVFTDENGAVLYGVENIDIPENAETVELPKLQKTDWIHGGTYGQSVALGAGTNTTLSTSQPYQNLTFQSGVLLDDTVLDFSSTKPLVEDSTVTSIPLESPTSSFLNGVTAQGIASGDTSSNWVMFGHSGGKGGTDIINLSKGTLPYTQHLSAYQGAYNLAQAQGKSYSVWFIAFIQGEGDISIRRTTNHFYNMLLQLKDDFDNDIKAITKQTFSPLMITYQTASHRYYPMDSINVANAQLKASVDRADIVMACPMYQFDYADNIHLTANSSVQLGKYLSKAAYKTWRHIEHDEPEFKPLQPEKVIWQGKIIDVTFNVPSGSLQFNTSIVAAATNMGFDIRVNNIVQNAAIVSLSIVGSNRVRIVLDQDYPAGVLTYAQGRTGDPNTSGSATGPRGNLCDQAGASDNYIDTLGTTRYMHNWCVIFSYHRVRGFFQ